MILLIGNREQIGLSTVRCFVWREPTLCTLKTYMYLPVLKKIRHIFFVTTRHSFPVLVKSEYCWTWICMKYLLQESVLSNQQSVIYFHHQLMTSVVREIILDQRVKCLKNIYIYINKFIMSVNFPNEPIQSLTVYSESCLSRILDTTKSCINQTLTKVSLQEIYINLTCINQNTCLYPEVKSWSQGGLV